MALKAFKTQSTSSQNASISMKDWGNGTKTMIKEKEIKCYAEAIKIYPTHQPSVAYDHWSLFSAIKEEKGDSEGVIEELKSVC
jgi:hypothetical protein